MSHNVKITIIANQEIKILGKFINVHDLAILELDSFGNAINYTVKKQDNVGVEGKEMNYETCHKVNVQVATEFPEIRFRGETVNMREVGTMFLSSGGEVVQVSNKEKGRIRDIFWSKTHPAFKLADLVGCNVNIRSFRDGDCELIVAQDTETTRIYVLKEILHGTSPK